MNIWAIFQLAFAIGAALAGLAVGQEVEVPGVFITWNDGRKFLVIPKVRRLE